MHGTNSLPSKRADPFPASDWPTGDSKRARLRAEGEVAAGDPGRLPPPASERTDIQLPFSEEYAAAPSINYRVEDWQDCNVDFLYDGVAAGPLGPAVPFEQSRLQYSASPATAGTENAPNLPFFYPESGNFDRDSWPTTAMENTLGYISDENVIASEPHSALDLEGDVTMSISPMGDDAAIEEMPRELELEEACFGMVVDSKAQLFDIFENVRDSGLLSARLVAGGVQFLTAVSRDNHIALQHKEDVDVAVLDTSTTEALWAIGKLKSCRFEYFVEASHLSKAIREHKGGAKAVVFPVNINVYGPRVVGDEVGEILSEARLFLQNPSHASASIYDNPHILYFSDPHDRVEEHAPALTVDQQSRNTGLEIEALLNDLGHCQYLEKEIPLVNDRVTTSLKSHQKIGLNFIAQREGRRPLSVPSLYERQVLNEKPCYVHVIVGTRKSNPDSETVGGILADEMGLGKTLTMLASILDSTKEAHEFAAESTDDMPNTKGTLVVAPSALVLDEWLTDIKVHISPQNLRVLVYRGSSKVRDLGDLLKNDIVLTTYSTLTSTYRNESGLLYSVNWFRVILDEAHSIRNDQTQQFRAVATLSARYRWCLTGTPIHNGLGDLGALVNFLRVPLLCNKTAFWSVIAKPIERNTSNCLNNLRLLLQSICIRRTKDLIGLDDPQEIVHEIQLSAEETKLYKDIASYGNDLVSQNVNRSKSGKSHQPELWATMRHRRLCNHGTMDLELQENPGFVSENDDDENEFSGCTADSVCAMCSCDLSSSCLTPPPCKHCLCSECFANWEEEATKRKGKKLFCAVCRDFVVTRINNPAKGRRVESRSSLNLEGHSTKVSRLVEDILQFRHSEKCIVFSSWLKTLDIVAAVLDDRGISFCRIDGTVGTTERQNALERFQNESGISVLLMTLGTGAVGLNITAATRVHILEPQWNPSVERQAIGRAVRLGQTRNVKVVRYITRGTIEVDIRRRQTRKLHLATIGWGSSH